MDEHVVILKATKLATFTLKKGTFVEFRGGVLSFYFKLILNLQKSCKNDTEDLCIFFTQLHLMLTPYIKLWYN